MEPAFHRGDLLFLTNHAEEPVRAGDIVVFKIEGREIPIVHRVLKVHEKWALICVIRKLDRYWDVFHISHMYSITCKISITEKLERWNSWQRETITQSMIEGFMRPASHGSRKKTWSGEHEGRYILITNVQHRLAFRMCTFQLIYQHWNVLHVLYSYSVFQVCALCWNSDYLNEWLSKI